MTDEDVYDEDGRNISSLSRALGARLQAGIVRRSRWLNASAERVGSSHKIDDRDGLRALLDALVTLSNFRSGMTIKPGKVTVPRDYETWKQARKKLASLAKVLADADKLLTAALDDPVQLAALVQLDETEQVGDMINEVYRLRELVERAATIKSSSGNRPNPDWHAHAAEECGKFWTEHKGEKPTPYFNEAAKPNRSAPTGNMITEPANAFSRWFCDVMDTVAELSVSECQTALKKKPPDKSPFYPFS